MKPQIPWLRVFVEGVVIVGSILLAFGIDAWWEGRQEREDEGRLLAALLAETRGTLTEIDRNVGFHEGIIASADALLSAPLTPTESISEDSLDVLIGDLTWKRSVDFQTSTLNTILFGGRLAIVEDPELRDRITQWQGALDEIADVAAHDWELAAEEVREYVRWNGNLAQLSNVMTRVPGLPDGGEMPSQTPIPEGRRNHFELLRQTEFRTIVLERRWAQVDLLDANGGYPNLRASAVELIAALEQEVGR